MTAPEQAGPPVVTAEAGTRLEQLAAEYDAAKAAEAEAKARFESVKDGIKTELAERAARGEVVLRAAGLAAPLRLHSVTSWKLNTKALKADAPETYVRHAYQQTSWRLEAVK